MILLICGFLSACATTGDKLDGVSSATLSETAWGETELRASSRSAIVLFSSSDNNTLKIANEIASVLDTLRNILEAQGCEVEGEYNCPGFNRNSFLILFGGINKGRPNSKDLQNARRFAKSLLPLFR